MGHSGREITYKPGFGTQTGFNKGVLSVSELKLSVPFCTQNKGDRDTFLPQVNCHPLGGTMSSGASILYPCQK